MPADRPKLLYVVNIPRFFVSHRLPLALAARQNGFDTHVATSIDDRESTKIISENGLPLHPIPLSQHGTNPLTELHALFALWRLYRQLKPDLVHHVSIKPVLYGGIAARLSGQKAIVHAMSGLGYVFVSEETKAALLRRLTQPLIRAATSGSSTRMIFQNPDDMRQFLNHGLITAQKAILIRGSGVDENVFAPQDEITDGLPVVLFAGRLLWQKGIAEFVETARRLKGKARFRVAGYEERTSPLNVPVSHLRRWADEGIIEWLGKRDDMPQVYAEANIVCLPSTYGEGVPKVLIEAAACGRPCIATDSPGCREIVRHEENGLIVPPGDIGALTAAIERLLIDPALRLRMGRAGRKIALEGFTLSQVVTQTIHLYRELLNIDD